MRERACDEDQDIYIAKGRELEGGGSLDTNLARHPQYQDWYVTLALFLPFFDWHNCSRGLV